MSEITPKSSMRQWLLSDVAKTELGTIAGNLISGERLANIVYNIVTGSPLLAQCTIQSIIAATKQLATLGCIADNIHGYLTPRKVKTKDGKYEWIAVAVPSARGMRRVATRAGITNINIGIVRKGDSFTWRVRNGSFECYHQPAWDNGEWNLLADPEYKAAPLGYYVTWNDRSGHPHGCRMSFNEVLEIMRTSESYKSVEKKRNAPDATEYERNLTCPWHTYFNEMALKTVQKRAAKQWDLDLETVTAMEAMDTAEFGPDSEARRSMRVVTPTRASAPSLIPAADTAEPAAQPSLQAPAEQQAELFAETELTQPQPQPSYREA